MLYPATATYLWYKTAKFSARKVYHYGFLGWRTWLYEGEKLNPSVGEYFFDDVVGNCDENFPDYVAGEIAKKKWEKGEWEKLGIISS